jgi:hypothetical protein
MREKATLQEIETHWSYYDLVLANEALDITDEIEEEAHRRANDRAKAGR